MEEFSGSEEAVYSRTMLRFYDAMVYRVNLPIFWRCPVARLSDHYEANLSAEHLEIGVGTGYLLDHAQFPVQSPRITLMDLNANPLRYTARRLSRYTPQTHQMNILSPWGLPPASFESVAMSNMLHCVPGNLAEKGVVFEQARSVLAPGGTLFGSTILGEEANHTRRSRAAIRRLNRREVFRNLDDRLEDLDAALGHTFPTHRIEVQGVMAIFTAQTES
jgi:SAM-dependent methyltransferase